MPIALHELREGPAAIDVARRLKRQSAYDAAYIVLAQQLAAEVWTLDSYERIAHGRSATILTSVSK